MRLIDADALLMNMNLAIAILEGTMKNLGLQDDAECQMELKAYRDIRDGIKDEPTIEPSAQPATNCSEIPNGSDDTISRRAAIDAIDKALSRTFTEPCGEMILKDVPSVQPEPHEGHWVGGDGSYICSECNSSPMDFIETMGSSFDVYVETLMNFCPNCGADMREENES